VHSSALCSSPALVPQTMVSFSDQKWDVAEMQVPELVDRFSEARTKQSLIGENPASEVPQAGMSTDGDRPPTMVAPGIRQR
jgi:hypothetical protein